MDLAEARRRASELSGGVSSEPIKSLILSVLDGERASGSLLDFGAGTGELLARLHALSSFDRLAGVDLFARPSSLPPSRMSEPPLEISESLPALPMSQSAKPLLSSASSMIRSSPPEPSSVSSPPFPCTLSSPCPPLMESPMLPPARVSFPRPPAM